MNVELSRALILSQTVNLILKNELSKVSQKVNFQFYSATVDSLINNMGTKLT